MSQATRVKQKKRKKNCDTRSWMAKSRCSDMFDTRRLLRATHDVSSAMQPSATFCYLNIDLKCAPCMTNYVNNVLRVSPMRVFRTLLHGEFGLGCANIHGFVLNVQFWMYNSSTASPRVSSFDIVARLDHMEVMFEITSNTFRETVQQFGIFRKKTRSFFCTSPWNLESTCGKVVMKRSVGDNSIENNTLNTAHRGRKCRLTTYARHSE